MAASVVLGELTRARRARRAATVDWTERLYQAYLTVIGAFFAVGYGTTLVGDRPAASSTVSWLEANGWLATGLVLAFVVWCGARSGVHGGPLTLEPAFVRHVLLGPVERRAAMREPVVRAFSRSAVLGGALGVMAGVVAAERLPHSTVGLVGVLGGVGAMTGLAATAVALCTASGRASGAVTQLAASVLAVGTGLLLGRAAMSGLETDPAALLVALITACTLVALGVWLSERISLEAAERRGALIGGLRLAVTQQDLRAVTLLHRRLSQSYARSRPWVSLPSTPWPSFDRGVQGLARLSGPRLIRLALMLSVAAGSAALASSDNPLLWIVVVAAAHVVGIDLNESLAQEIDHPGRWREHPYREGRVLVAHLAAPAATLGVVGLAASGATSSAAPIALAVAAVIGGACSIAMPPFDLARMANFASPESVGLTMLTRALWPTAVTASGLATVATGAAGLLLTAGVASAALWWLSSRSPA